MLNKIDLHDRLKCIDVLSIEKKEWEAYRIHEEWSHRHPNPKLDSPLFQAAKEYDANAKKLEIAFESYTSSCSWEEKFSSITRSTLVMLSIRRRCYSVEPRTICIGKFCLERRWNWECMEIEPTDCIVETNTYRYNSKWSRISSFICMQYIQLRHYHSWKSYNIIWWGIVMFANI